MGVAKKRPHKAPQQVDGEDITDPYMDGFQLKLAGIGYFKAARVEYHQAYSRQAEDADQVNPVKPAGARIPNLVGFNLSHGAVLRCHIVGFYASESQSKQAQIYAIAMWARTYNRWNSLYP